jgi:hypothetical protein
MSRRFVAVLSLVLVSLSLSACSDVTAPTPTSQRQIGASGPSTLTTCKGGSLESSGKC